MSRDNEQNETTLCTADSRAPLMVHGACECGNLSGNESKKISDDLQISTCIEDNEVSVDYQMAEAAQVVLILGDKSPGIGYTDSNVDCQTADGSSSDNSCKEDTDRQMAASVVPWSVMLLNTSPGDEHAENTLDCQTISSNSCGSDCNPLEPMMLAYGINSSGDTITENTLDDLTTTNDSSGSHSEGSVERQLLTANPLVPVMPADNSPDNGQTDSIVPVHGVLKTSGSEHLETIADQQLVTTNTITMAMLLHDTCTGSHYEEQNGDRHITSDKSSQGDQTLTQRVPSGGDDDDARVKTHKIQSLPKEAPDEDDIYFYYGTMLHETMSQTMSDEVYHSLHDRKEGDGTCSQGPTEEESGNLHDIVHGFQGISQRMPGEDDDSLRYRTHGHKAWPDKQSVATEDGDATQADQAWAIGVSVEDDFASDNETQQGTEEGEDYSHDLLQRDKALLSQYANAWLETTPSKNDNNLSDLTQADPPFPQRAAREQQANSHDRRLTQVDHSWLAEPQLIAAALDLGKYSSYAIALADKPNDVIVNKWEDQEGRKSFKTPTCVLTRMSDNGSHQFLAFGSEAERQYQDQRTTDNQLCLFINFYSCIYKQCDTSDLIDVRGRVTIPPVTIITMALRYMKEDLLRYINDKMRNYDRSIDDHLISWVFVVPTLAADQAKIILRKSAFQAGLIKELSDTTRLLFALRTETVLLYHQSLNPTDLMNQDGSNKICGVVDISEDTVNTAVFGVTSSGHIQPLDVEVERPWHYVDVDDALSDELQKVLGQDFMLTLRRHRFLWTKMKTEFASARHVRSPEDIDDIALFVVDLDLSKLYYEATGGDIHDVNEGPFYVNDEYEFMVRKDVLNSITSSAIDPLATIVKADLSSLNQKKMDYIFITGGTEYSQDLETVVQNSNGRDVEVLMTEDDTVLVVLRGALEFWKDPTLITRRFTTRTYGIATTEPFDAKVHRLEKKRGQFCDDIFCPFVMKDTAVDSSCVYTSTFSVAKGELTVEMELFACDRYDKDEVKYVDEQDVHQVGIVRYQIIKTACEQDCQIEFLLSFAKTEILATIREQNAGNPMKHYVFQNV